MKINILAIFLLTVNSIKLNAQIFDFEQANSNIKWKQINTKNFQLIFPKKFSPNAVKVADIINEQLQQSHGLLKRKSKKISIVIQENTLEQNGFVQLAPRKSELYSTPSGIADNQSWLTNLSLHEVRHVAQFDNLTGKIRKPYGQQLAMALFAINLPSWYFEGDAVLHETLYSTGGRGRLASWQMPIRANIQSNLNFNFNKYVHGSYKNIVPSYYTIGYFMNSELYQKDVKTTSNIYEDMHTKLLRPFNFQRALKKHYGGKANYLFDNTITNLKEIWATKPENKYPNRITFNDKYPTNYILPQTQNGVIYALQQGPQKVSNIVKIDPSSNTKPVELTKTGAQLMPYFEIKNHLIVWDEYRRNARFSKETFNVINVFNTNTNQQKTITSETRYYTPTLSPNLEKIACVEVDQANNSYLIILDILTEKKIKSINIPDGIHIQQPQYNPEGDKIIAIAVSDKGTSLAEIDLNSNSFTQLIPWTNLQIERPIYYNNSIVFKSNIDNKDDIFQLHNDEIFRITDVQYGAFNPTIDQKTLYFNDYTVNGLQINHIDLTKIERTKTTLKMSETLYSAQNNFIIPEDSTRNTNTYAIEDYNTFSHAINFHSITLSGNNFESFDNLKPGIFLLSNDVLNTTQTRLGVEYDTNIKKTSYSAEISYQKYYPKFTLAYQNRGLIGTAGPANKPDSIQRFDYRENLTTLNIQLPFVKFRGNKIYSYGLNFGTSYQHRYNVSLPLKNFNTNIEFPLNYQIYLGKNSRRSAMDLFPRWGQNFSFTYRHLPFEPDLNGTSWSLRTNFYFPGFVTNHGFQLRYAMQENTGRFNGSIDIPLISGINYIPYQNVKNTLIIDYKLPLVYPDWSIGQLTYLKRIYAGVGANYLNINKSTATPQSISGSLFFDFNIFKYNLPNLLLETKASYITVKNAVKNIYPEISLSYNY